MRTITRALSRTRSRFRPQLERLEDRRLLNGGGLDPTFGIGGRVITDLGGTDSLHAMAIQTDGKIVAVGGGYDVVRYNPDGSLDTSFGGSGVVTNGPPGAALGVAIQSDGKIVVVGVTSTPTTGDDFAVVRYNVNGSLDTSFGGKGTGIVTIDFATVDFGFAVAIQSDGKIVVAGVAGGNFGMARLTVTGALDKTFDGDGKVVTQFAGGGSMAFGVTIQQDGKIVLAGEAGGGGGVAGGMALARYKTNGNLDATFGSRGEVTLGSLGLVEPTVGAIVAMQANGKIVVAGELSVGGNPGQAALVRLNTNGSLDNTFAGNGILATSLGGNGEARFNSIAVQSNGQIVVGGFSNDSSTGTSITRVATARVNADGTMDTTFGTSGVVLTTFGGSSAGGNGVALTAVLIQPSDGKVVIGSSLNGDFAFERYFGS